MHRWLENWQLNKGIELSVGKEIICFAAGGLVVSLGILVLVGGLNPFLKIPYDTKQFINIQKNIYRKTHVSFGGFFGETF